MNSLPVVLVFVLSITLTLAAPSSTTENKVHRSARECNVTYPFPENSSLNVAAIDNGKISEQEKCFLNCLLQKLGFLDESSNIRNTAELVNNSLKIHPGFANYSDVLIVKIYQINRSTKEIEDKCHKAFVIYNKFSDGLIELLIVSAKHTDIKDEIFNSVVHRKPINETSLATTDSFLKFDGIGIFQKLLKI